MANPSQLFFTYILLCSDDSLYVGHTSDVQSRVDLHNAGRAAKWTAARRPVRLIYQEEYQTELESIQRELQLKRWSNAKKRSLINGDQKQLKALSRCRTLHGDPPSSEYH